jgi:hypothetical protein
MTVKDIEKIISQEINNRWDLSNAHGVDLKKCLITPSKQIYYSFDLSEKFELWTVLEETPDLSGYKIYYNEKENNFGLGMLTNKNELICLGPYGTFLETFEAM